MRAARVARRRSVWTGITHPGALNSMGTWAWTGPGTESLAVDSASRTTVMRYIYRAP